MTDPTPPPPYQPPQQSTATYGQPQMPQGPYAPQPGDPGTLDLPWYGIGFKDAFRRAWKKYARFDGRASLSEYWWFALANFCVVLVAEIPMYVCFLLGGLLGRNGTNAGSVIFMILGGVFALALLVYAIASIVPSLALGVRRLHDAGYSGWLLLLAIIPFGGIVVLVLSCMPSKPEGMQYDRRS